MKTEVSNKEALKGLFILIALLIIAKFIFFSPYDPREAVLKNYNNYYIKIDSVVDANGSGRYHYFFGKDYNGKYLELKDLMVFRQPIYNMDIIVSGGYSSYTYHWYLFRNGKLIESTLSPNATYIPTIPEEIEGCCDYKYDSTNW